MKAHELIADPKRWTTGSMARDASGKSIGMRAATAVQWCASGAIFRCYSDAAEAEAVHKEARLLAHSRFDLNLWQANDRLQHAEVVALLKDAEAAAEAAALERKAQQQ